MEFLSLGYLLDSEMEPVCLLKVLLLIILNSEVSWGDRHDSKGIQNFCSLCVGTDPQLLSTLSLLTLQISYQQNEVPFF